MTTLAIQHVPPAKPSLASGIMLQRRAKPGSDTNQNDLSVIDLFKQCPSVSVDDVKVQNWIHVALSATGGDVKRARVALQGMRESNCCDVNMAAADHYLFAREQVGTGPLPFEVDAVRMTTAILAQTFAKIVHVMPRTGRCPVTPFSTEQMKWEMKGVEDGVSDGQKTRAQKSDTPSPTMRQSLGPNVPVSQRAGVDSPVLQTKLTVNTPGDKFEQEADRVAEQVMQMPEPQVQRKCDCGKSSADGECSECKRKKQQVAGSLQRVASSPVAGVDAPPIVNSVLSSPGSPMPVAARSFMENRFGQDFSQVRVHTDQRAADSAAAVNARAYTVGNNIVFGRGETPAGDRRLMAHELTHVVQQTTSDDRMIARAPALPDIGPDDLQHISDLAKELAEVFPKSVRGKVTVAVAIVEDSDGFRTLVYSVNRNGTSKALRAKAAELGLERWDPMFDRKGIKAAKRAYWHAEQLLIEAASENDFRVLAVAPSNKACPDCGEAAHADDADVANPKKGAQAAEQIEKNAVDAAEKNAAREGEKAVAGAAERKAVAAAGEQTAEGAARVAKEGLPKIIGRRLARIAASKTAKRALSLAPLVGWGFSAKDAWSGLKDAMNGHVRRGLAGIGCAAGDVASDVLHAADVVTGPGGTVASLAIQAGTITCQVVIELERSKERMQELQQEIERTGKLPPDERLKDYYEMDDEAIKELKEMMQPPAPTPEKTPAPLPKPNPPSNSPTQPFDPSFPMV